MAISPAILRTISRLRSRAGRDSKAMTADYRDRLDAEAKAMGYDKWGDFLRGAVRGGAVSSITRLVTVGGIGGRHAFVDPDFARRLKNGEIVDEGQAYLEMIESSIDPAVMSNALSIPARTMELQQEVERRDMIAASFWTGAYGQDRIVQTAAELCSVISSLTSMAIDAGTSHAWMLPPLWTGRAPSAHAVRDVVVHIRAHRVDTVDDIGDGLETERHAESWWRDLERAIDAHHPLGVSSGVRHLFKPHEDGMRRAMEDLLVDRLSAVCRRVPKSDPAKPDRIVAARKTFEEIMTKRMAAKTGVNQSDHGSMARAELDGFLNQSGMPFGDDAWSWTPTMARRLADIALEPHD